MAAIDLAYSDTAPDDPSKSALVILHGLFGNRRNWGAIVKQLGETFRVITVDMRNHGESPWSNTMTYEAMAEDVAALIQTLEIGPAHVLGHSMGGKAAMVLALTEPDLVDRLIVADIPPAPRDSGLLDYIQAMRALDVSTMSRRGEAEAALAPAIPEAGIRTFLAQNLAPKDGGGLQWRVNLPVLEDKFDDIVAFPDIDSDDAFPRPALHLTGGNSDYVQPRHHAEIDRLFPDSEIEAIPNAGHWLHAEQPALFTQAVREFLPR